MVAGLMTLNGSVCNVISAQSLWIVWQKIMLHMHCTWTQKILWSKKIKLAYKLCNDAVILDFVFLQYYVMCFLRHCFGFPDTEWLI